MLGAGDFRTDEITAGVGGRLSRNFGFYFNAATHRSDRFLDPVDLRNFNNHGGGANLSFRGDWHATAKDTLIFNLSGKSVASSEKWEGVFEMDLDKADAYVGGPVIGYNGEMVGVVGVLTIDNAPHTFLIPANAVHDALDHVIAGTLGKRPTLGVYYLPITKALALGRGLTRDRGALIYSRSGSTGLAVIANSPGAMAGLQAGDIIESVNGIEVNLDNSLPVLLSQFNSGDSIVLVVFRAGAEKSVTVNL